MTLSPVFRSDAGLAFRRVLGARHRVSARWKNYPWRICWRRRHMASRSSAELRRTGFRSLRSEEHRRYVGPIGGRFAHRARTRGRVHNVAGKIPIFQSACRVSYCLHFRMRGRVAVHDDPAGGLPDNPARSINDHGAIGSIAGFAGEITHLERAPNKCRRRWYCGLIYAARLRLSAIGSASQRAPSNSC